MSPKERRDDVLTRRECRALRILARDGWTVGELALTMQVSEGQIHEHRQHRCAHGPRPAPEEVEA